MNLKNKRCSSRSRYRISAKQEINFRGKEKAMRRGGSFTRWVWFSLIWLLPVGLIVGHKQPAEAQFTLTQITNSTGVANIRGPNARGESAAHVFMGTIGVLTEQQKLTASDGVDTEGQSATGAAHVLDTAGPAIVASVVLNLTSVRTGDLLRYNASIGPTSLPEPVDIYLGALLPDGVTFLSLVETGPGTVNSVLGPGPVPFRANVQTGVTFPFEYTFTGSEPPGTYYAYAGAARAGRDPLQQENRLVQQENRLALSVASFTFNMTVVPCDFSSEPGEPERCFGGVGERCKGIFGVPFIKDESTCEVQGWMSVGSILHDRCCLGTNNAGWNCRGINTGGDPICQSQWDEASTNTVCSAIPFGAAPRQWRKTFGPYPAGNLGDDTSRCLRAPDLARVNPRYERLCESGKCRTDADGNTIKSDTCGQYCECSPGCQNLSTGEQVYISGEWEWSETATVTCTIDGDSETETLSESGIININQDACNVSWITAGHDRTGTIHGNNIQVSGAFVVPLVGGVNFTQNTLFITGTIQTNNALPEPNEDKINTRGSGIATGTFCDEEDCFSFSCTGETTAVFTRPPEICPYDSYGRMRTE